MADFFLGIGTALKWAGFALSPLLLLPFILIVVASVRPLAHRVSHGIDRLSGGALTAAMAMALVMMFAQLAVVIARYAFGLAFTWLNEIVIYAFAAMFLLAAAGALRDDAHVRVDILRTRFGPRGLAAVELAGAYLFIIPICLLILWAAAPALTNAWARFEGSRESDGLPLLFLFKTLVPLFAVLLLTQGLSQAIKAALVLSGESAPDSEEVPGTSGAI